MCDGTAAGGGGSVFVEEVGESGTLFETERWDLTRECGEESIALGCIKDGFVSTVVGFFVHVDRSSCVVVMWAWCWMCLCILVLW